MCVWSVCQWGSSKIKQNISFKKKNSKQNTWNRKPSLPTSSYAHLENWTRSLCCLESPSSTEIIPRSSCINTDHSILSPDGHPAHNYRFGYNKALWKLPCLDLRISRDEDPPMSPGNYSWCLITSSVKALLCRKDWSVVHQQHYHGGVCCLTITQGIQLQFRRTMSGGLDVCVPQLLLGSAETSQYSPWRLFSPSLAIFSFKSPRHVHIGFSK